MGYWNETCAITNLPIFAGEKIAAIALRKNPFDDGQKHTYYPDGVWYPVGFPFYGEYDGYGRVKNAVTHPWNRHLFQINGMTEQNTIECLDIDEKLLFVHEDVYKALIRQVGDRPVYGKNESYREAIVNDFYHTIQHMDSDGAAPFRIGQKRDINAIKILCNCWNTSQNPAEKEHAVHEFVDSRLFYTALGLLRKGYGTISGTGSQYCETRLHMIVARFVIDHVEHTCEEDDDDIYDKDGLEESMFSFT